MLGSVVAEIRRKRIVFIVASLAYYAFISLYPLLLFPLALASLLRADAVASVVIDFAQGVLTPARQQETIDALTNRSDATGVTQY